MNGDATAGLASDRQNHRSARAARRLWLSAARSRARSLAEAYLFLRNVEHKLQIVSGLQTHTLPRGDVGMRQLGVRLRMGRSDRVLARLRADAEQTSRPHRESVSRNARRRRGGKSYAGFRCRAGSVAGGVGSRERRARPRALGFAHPRKLPPTWKSSRAAVRMLPPARGALSCWKRSGRFSSTRSARCPIRTWRCETSPILFPRWARALHFWRCWSNIPRPGACCSVCSPPAVICRLCLFAIPICSTRWCDPISRGAGAITRSWRMSFRVW